MKQNTDKIELMSEKLKETLKRLFFGVLPGFNKHRLERAPRAIIETGTYIGTGTTRLIAELIVDANNFSKGKRVKPPPFYTIEASEKNWKKAKENLAMYSSWIETIHGSSLDVDECIEFIRNDDLLKEHKNYPDILIDSDDPVPFYVAEVEGQLFGSGKKGENNVLARILPDLRDKAPLVILDSAGGIGFLEFTTVMKIMQGRRFYLLLDDIAHVKHVRSYRWCKLNNFPIVGEEEDRWALFVIKGIPGNPKWWKGQ